MRRQDDHLASEVLPAPLPEIDFQNLRCMARASFAGRRKYIFFNELISQPETLPRSVAAKSSSKEIKFCAVQHHAMLAM
jgi:hypothetical protein